MRRLMLGLFFIKAPLYMLTLCLLACPTDDCQNSLAGPTTDVATTTTSIEARPPRVDQPFTWRGAAGFSLFAGLHLDAAGIEAIYSQALAARRNTGRVCAETEFWRGDDDYPRIPRNLERLDAFLDAVARIPGAQVLLMSNCTLKHGNVSWEKQRQWNRDVARIAGRYKNVAIEVVNEPYHCNHFFHGREDLVRQLIREARSISGLFVGADDTFCKGDDSYRHALYSSIEFSSFHPCRTHGGKPWDPARKHLRRLVEQNGGLAVLSETVAWDDSGGDCDDGLRTCDKERIRSYEQRCEETEGCIYFFHSKDGLAARVPFSWMGR